MIEFTFWDIARNLLLAARWTVLLSIVAFTGGAIVGVAILLARISKRNWLRRGAQYYIGLFQGTPLLMQLFLLFFGLPLLGFRIEAWTAAALGLTLCASAFLAERRQQSWPALFRTVAAGHPAAGLCHNTGTDSRFSRAVDQEHGFDVDHRI
jgi:His/Glu/Gln/Arg/opine family amino acid ABC transporter permease subunit